jgi:hypothetical protein
MDKRLKENNNTINEENTEKWEHEHDEAKNAEKHLSK